MKYERITPDDQRHYFFGYYDKFQDNKSGKLLLSHSVDFFDRMPNVNDKARICLIDSESRKSQVITETSAWCWQQGSMLQWFNQDCENKIIFNYRLEKNIFGSCVMDIRNGKKRYYDIPIYCLSPDGRYGLGLNFSRLGILRPGYGYVYDADLKNLKKIPEDDGIWRLDFKTGKKKLIISIGQLKEIGKSKNYLNSMHWVNHILVAPDSEKFVFLHRWQAPDAPAGRMHQFFSASCDGGELTLLNDNLVGHFNWKDNKTLIIEGIFESYSKDIQLYLFDTNTHESSILPRTKILQSTHMAYDSGGKNLVMDTYGEYHDLYLFNEQLERQELGSFYSLLTDDNVCRCDLHPRWSRNGKQIYFDSTHEGFRGVYRVKLET